MSQYLRDETLKNLSLSKEALGEINNELTKTRDTENKAITDDTISLQLT